VEQLIHKRTCTHPSPHTAHQHCCATATVDIKPRGAVRVAPARRALWRIDDLKGHRIK